MTPRTIEETFEHRMADIVKSFCKEWDFSPSTEEELFDFMRVHSQDFSRLITEDMIEWAGEKFWFDKLKEG